MAPLASAGTARATVRRRHAVGTGRRRVAGGRRRLLGPGPRGPGGRGLARAVECEVGAIPPTPGGADPQGGVGGERLWRRLCRGVGPEQAPLRAVWHAVRRGVAKQPGRHRQGRRGLGRWRRVLSLTAPGSGRQNQQALRRNAQEDGALERHAPGDRGPQPLLAQREVAFPARPGVGRVHDPPLQQALLARGP